ncbi:hypothetical protein [Marinobacter manganoxydans]|uniref:Uncharacterized protein n=1 Tax=Marinobacter manganoxydans MnI7-9 TaxID=1094979 RepID=G6YTQ4_9GAMM|nr:hypothetical protein [Marinobacter manganoxydans]EHJ04393.1 hypothetical protein KYE_11231 [Marinobacter manganoxydans MnI7-9]
MRDLYRRLGIKPTASSDEIQKALKSIGETKLKADVTEALLNEGRRKTYDQVHSTLSDIGKLRAKLRLSSGDNWRDSGNGDFNNHAESPSSASLTLENKLRDRAIKAQKQSLTRRLGSALAPFIIAPLAVGVFFILVSNDNSPGTDRSYEESTQQTGSSTTTPYQNSSNTNSSNSYPEFNEPVMPLPQTGAMERYTGQLGEAPLQIKTSSGANYLVRLEDMSSGENVMDIFVRGGTTVEVEVPLGTFELKYAAGQKWYGMPHLFGPETTYSKADTAFRFFIEGQQVRGYTVTLYQVQGGNLQTSKINPGQF